MLNRFRFNNLLKTQKRLNGQSLIPNETKLKIQQQIAQDQQGQPRSQNQAPQEPMSLQSKLITYSLLVGLPAAGFYAASRPIDVADGQQEPMLISSAPAYMKPFKRVQYRILKRYKQMVDPQDFMQPFLPPPTVIQGHTVPTLIIEPEETLFATEWSEEKGWHVKKRPYADYFLGYLARYYEIVIWASRGYNQNGESLCERSIEKLNSMSGGALSPQDPQYPNGNRLFRDHLSFDLDGGSLRLVKDLNMLGRDLKNVVVIDYERDGVLQKCSDNHIIPNEWREHSDQDTYLLDMLPFLETLAMSNGDFRQYLSQYHDLDIPKIFAHNVEIAKKLKLKNSSTAAGQHNVKSSENSIASAIMSFFGLKKQAPSSSTQSSTLDKEDEALLQHHSQFARFMESVKEEQAAQIKAAEQEQQQFMQHAKKMKVTLWDLMTKGADVAIRDALDDEGKQYLDKMSGVASQPSA